MLLFSRRWWRWRRIVQTDVWRWLLTGGSVCRSAMLKHISAKCECNPCRPVCVWPVCCVCQIVRLHGACDKIFPPLSDRSSCQQYIAINRVVHSWTRQKPHRTCVTAQFSAMQNCILSGVLCHFRWFVPMETYILVVAMCCGWCTSWYCGSRSAYHSALVSLIIFSR